jgi:hypothetical protein
MPNAPGQPVARIAHRYYALNARPTRQERKNAPGGRRNPLKKLDPDKRIQGNPSLFSLIPLAWLGRNLARLGKIGIGLESPIDAGS